MLLHLGLIFLLVLFLKNDFTTAEIHFKKGAPHVILSNNALLRGSVDFSREGRPFHSFIGIPYGKVPARFQEAQPAPAWEGVLKATTSDKVCPQISFATGAAVGEEDCLFLNVFVPMNNTQRKGGLPVMMFIHGGGFAVGHGNEYGPQYFMDEDVIIITINYRLGVLGFLSTGNSVVPGNNGLKDLVLGLHWIQDNIKSFGGDPGKVTIFGESAGSALVHYLMLSPTTEGLFHRAISQSGTALVPWAYNHNPRALAVKLATHLKCPASDALSSEEIVACLKGFSPEELISAAMSLSPSWPPHGPENLLAFGPVAEPKDYKTPFLTVSPWMLLLDPSVPLRNVPWIVGVNEDEGIMSMASFISDENLFGELEAKWKDAITGMIILDRFIGSQEEKEIISDKIRQFYFGEKALSKESFEALMDLYSDSWFVHGTRTAATATAWKGSPVYLYQYAQTGPASILTLMGMPVTEEKLLKKIAHAQELVALFNLDNWLPSAKDLVKWDSEEDVQFSKNFVKMWVSFAIYGKPKHSWSTAKKDWKPISKNELEGVSPVNWYRITSSPDHIDEGEWKRPGTFSFWDKLFKGHLHQALLGTDSTSGTSEGKKTEL